MTDNFLDITHFPFVHVGTFGRWRRTRECRSSSWSRSTTVATGTATRSGEQHRPRHLRQRPDDEVVERAMGPGFHLPFDVRSTIRYETGLEHILLLLSTPIDDVTSYFTFVVWRNDDFSVSAEEVIRFDLAIGAEDKRDARAARRRAAARPDHARQRAGRQVLGRVAPTSGRALEPVTRHHADHICHSDALGRGRTDLLVQSGRARSRLDAIASNCIWGRIDPSAPPVCSIASGALLHVQAVTHHAGDAPDLMMDDALQELWAAIPPAARSRRAHPDRADPCRWGVSGQHPRRAGPRDAATTGVRIQLRSELGLLYDEFNKERITIYGLDH